MLTAAPRTRWLEIVLFCVGTFLAYRLLRGREVGCPPSDPWCREHLAKHGAGVTAGIFDHAAQAAKEERHPAGTLIDDLDDLVDEASDDSFPCSDPPSWTARGGATAQ